MSAAQFGLRWNPPDYLREIHKQLGADLTRCNGEDSCLCQVLSQESSAADLRECPCLAGHFDIEIDCIAAVA